MMKGMRKNRAMTLVELLVAMTISVVMMGAAFYIARTEFNAVQTQQDVMDALKDAKLALRYMTMDLEAAGFLASPDMTKDPDVCLYPTFSNQKRPVAIQFERVGYKDNTTNKSPFVGNLNQGIVPMSVILIGAYSVHRVFRTDHISGTEIFLQDTGGLNQTEFERVFASHHILRLVNQVNKMMFFKITSVDYANKKIVVAQAVPSASGDCGVSGFGIGLAVNAVSVIQYRIKVNQTVQHPNATATLVREELNPFQDWSVVSTLTIAENAVDLQFYDFILELDTTGTDPDLSPFHNSTGTNPYSMPETVLDLQSASPPAYLGTDSSKAAAVAYGSKDLRFVTIKLSLRTKDEDNTIAYNQTGGHGNTAMHVPINYFDLYPSVQGLARVVSLVSKAEMTNLEARNIK